jgi:single-stranded-DNA-specific exonuclease
MQVIEIDAEAPISGLSGVEIKGLMRFEPCGHGNEKPVLLSRNVRVSDARAVGSDHSHLRLTLKDGVVTWPGIAFGKADLELAETVDVVYSLQTDWTGQRVELEVIDVAPSYEGRQLEVGR